MSSALAHPETEDGFGRFRLAAPIAAAVHDSGFRAPRPIQSETIPACLSGRDVMGLAQTGTGKTAAFAIPILHRLLAKKARATRVLVLAPTRELARQIDEEMRSFARHTKLTTLTVFGGVPTRPQIRALKRRPDVVVGCPGRVLDLLQQGVLDVSRVETLVVDEADHMFDMGFLRDLEKILARLPKRRQNLLFSATMPRPIRSLASRILSKPHVVELAHSAPSDGIEHFLYSVPETGKRQLLERVLAYDECRTAIVFTRTKHRAKRTAARLAKQGLRAVSLQGDMSQAQRDRAMAGFREGRFDVLVATDIAARGLDVAGIDYVVNFDVPSTAEAYTHRIGRTGRSGASGRACTFVTASDAGWVRATERALGERLPVRRSPIAVKAVEREIRPERPHATTKRDLPARRSQRARSRRGPRRRVER